MFEDNKTILIGYLPLFNYSGIFSQCLVSFLPRVVSLEKDESKFQVKLGNLSPLIDDISVSYTFSEINKFSRVQLKDENQSFSR